MVGVEPLTGATTSAVHGVRLQSDRELVIRRHVWPSFLAEEPGRASHEARVLEVIEGSTVPAPRLVAVDPNGSACDVPAVLMTRLPGLPDPALNPAVLAETAAAIASIGPLELPWSYERYWAGTEPRPPPWARDPTAWWRVIEAATAPLQVDAPGFVHRDFHPWNVLSVDGAVTGVVDWLAGCLGPWQVDVAHCRVNLALLDADADLYQRIYEDLTGRTYQPLWDAVCTVDALPYYHGQAAVDDWAGLPELAPDPPTARARMNALVEATAAAL